MQFLKQAERWLPRRVEPITIRAWLSSPLAWDTYDGVTLDGSLQFAVVALETGMTPDDAFAGYRGPKVDIPIPIADQGLSGFSVARISWAHPAHCTEGVRVRRRRLRVDSMGGDSMIRMNQGVFKSTQLPTPTISTPYVDFFADGDPDRLRVLLTDAAALGRSRGGGLGYVFGYEILPREGSVFVRKGRLARTVPAGSIVDVDPGSYVTREANTRAPYWHRASRTMCWVPILEDQC